MALRYDAAAGAEPATWDLPLDGVCRNQPRGALEQLGPVLLVARRAHAPDLSWRLGSVIDAYGVREFVETARWRLYRLPDSDFLGWERLSHLCQPWPTTPPPARMLHSRCASHARFSSSGWSGVPHISQVGWELTQTILRLEGAHLCRAAWLDMH